MTFSSFEIEPRCRDTDMGRASALCRYLRRQAFPCFFARTGSAEFNGEAMRIQADFQIGRILCE
jgi:hypothetical protein